MKLQCDVEVINRMLPTFGMKNRGKGARAVLSIGRHVDKTTQKSNVYLLICTAKDRAGSKYKVGGEGMWAPDLWPFVSNNNVCVSVY